MIFLAPDSTEESGISCYFYCEFDNGEQQSMEDSIHVAKPQMNTLKSHSLNIFILIINIFKWSFNNATVVLVQNNRSLEVCSKTNEASLSKNLFSQLPSKSFHPHLCHLFVFIKQ